MFCYVLRHIKAILSPNRTDTDFPKHKFNNWVAGILGDMVIKTEQYHRERFMLFSVAVEVSVFWGLGGVVLSSGLRGSGEEPIQWSVRDGDSTTI